MNRGSTNKNAVRIWSNAVAEVTTVMLIRCSYVSVRETVPGQERKHDEATRGNTAQSKLY